MLNIFGFNPQEKSGFEKYSPDERLEMKMQIIDMIKIFKSINNTNGKEQTNTSS